MSDETRGSAADSETNALIGAAIIGAAIGAGLGLLASRAAEMDATSIFVRSARKRVRKQLGRGAKAAGGAVSGARDAVTDFASRARHSFEDALEREVRQLRKAARQRRRRLGF